MILKTNNKGFTLVELMVVIVIIGILAAVAIPKFMSAADKAKASEFPSVLTGVYTAQVAVKAETGSYCPNTGTDLLDGELMPASKWFSYTANGTVATATCKAWGPVGTGDNATYTYATAAKAATTALKSLVKTWE